MKAILIARVSTEEQKEMGNSLPAQVIRLEKYCRNRNLTILKTFSFDESAYTDQRAEFDQILDFINQQKEKIAVCCDKVDRLSRNMFDKRISILYEKALRDDIELHFISDNQVINSNISATEKFQFGISLGLAKYYSDAISDNVRRAMEQKLRKGEWISKAPYGYKNLRNGNETDVIVDDYKAVVVRKVFELYGTGNYSMESLCRTLNADYGIRWSKGFLESVLRNPFYYGMMLCNGQLYPHRYPTVITQAAFDAVQKVKDSYQKRRVKMVGLPFLYRGLISCADCGLAVTPERHKGLAYYHCTQYNGKHGAKWLREEEITKQIGRIFKKLHVPEDILKQIIQTLSDLHQNKVEFHNAQYNELTKEQKTITTMLDNLYLDKLKGRITESEYDKFYQSLRDQVSEITIKLELLQDAEDNYYITSKYLLDLSSRAYDLFMSSEVEEKGQLVRLVLSNLQLKGENIVYEAHQPFDLLLKCSDRQLWCAWQDSNLQPADSKSDTLSN